MSAPPCLVFFDVDGTIARPGGAGKVGDRVDAIVQAALDEGCAIGIATAGDYTSEPCTGSSPKYWTTPKLWQAGWL